MATISSPFSLLPKPLKALLNLNPTPPQTQNPTPQPKSDNLGVISRRDISLSALSALVISHIVKPVLAAGPTVSECELTVAPNGLAFCDKVLGKGAPAAQGQLIKAHYVGKLENGKVFDSSYDRGKPLTFRIGVGEVIKGWDQGILGGEGIPPMLPGGKRTLKLPPELAYGVRGAGCRGNSCVIPPNSTLLFSVEYVGKV